MGKWTVDGRIKKKGEEAKKKPPKFDDKEVALFKEAFDTFTDDGGNMPTNLIATALRAFGQSPAEMEIHEIIIKVDKNRNGSIDFDEFLNLVENHTNKEVTADDLCEAFGVFDDAGKGIIPIHDLKYALTNLGEKLNEEEMCELLKMADIKKDGLIRYKSFVESIEAK